MTPIRRCVIRRDPDGWPWDSSALRISRMLASQTPLTRDDDEKGVLSSLPTEKRSGWKPCKPVYFRRPDQGRSQRTGYAQRPDEPGTAYCHLDVAVNDRVKTTNGQWIDGPASYYRVTVFRAIAEVCRSARQLPRAFEACSRCAFLPVDRAPPAMWQARPRTRSSKAAGGHARLSVWQ